MHQKIPRQKIDNHRSVLRISNEGCDKYLSEVKLPRKHHDKGLKILDLSWK